MALRGHVFDKQLFSSDCYALVTDTFLNKNSGIIKGCELTNTASTIYIDNGYFVVKGRPIQEEGGTTIEVEPGSIEGIYCKLVCEIDMSQTNTTTSLNQVSYKILEDTADYPTLVLEDITDGGTIYQFELAKFRRTLNGIEDFVDTRSFLNFDSIYDFVKNEIKKIEEGSLFITEEELETEMLNSGVVVSATEPTGDNREKVWIQKGKNLFNKNNYNLYKGFIHGENLFFVNNDYANTVYLRVKPNTTYTISRKIVHTDFAIGTGSFIPIANEQRINSYRDYKNELSATITTGTEDKYIYIYLLWSDGATTTLEEVLQGLQIEQGTTATEYEAYIEPKIYVKNDNDVYEEFISKEDTLVKYSTEEQVIGTWIDGKPLYEKVIDGITPNTTTDTKVFDIPNIETLVNIKGIISNWLPINSIVSPENSSILYFQPDGFMMAIGSSQMNKPFRAIVEYTKTTD